MRNERAFGANSRKFGVTFALAAAACGGGQSGSGAASPEPSTNASAGTSDAAHESEASSAPASSDETATKTPPSDEPEPPALASPLALCNQMCDRVRSLCTKTAENACRASCEQYEHPPAGCDAPLRTALQCAAKAEDLTCVIIAPESCAAEFRRVVSCTTGKEQTSAPAVAEIGLPDGWERFEAKAQGFAVALPRGASEKRDAKEPTYAVEHGAATYSVRVVPPPKDKPTQKNLVPLAMKLLGNCSRKLKLFGLIERPERVSIRYDSRCPDGAEWRGSFVITSQKMYVLKVSSPAGVKVDADAFVYGFELL